LFTQKETVPGFHQNMASSHTQWLSLIPRVVWAG